MKVAALLVMAGVLTTSVLAQKPTDISNLPAAVQKTIREKGEGELKKVRTRKDANDATIYEADFKDRGDQQILLISQDGSVISETDGKGRGKAKGKEKNKDKKEKNRNNSADGEDENDADADSPVIKRTSTGPVIRSGESKRPVPPEPPQTAQPPVVIGRTPPSAPANPVDPARTANRPVVRPSSPTTPVPAATARDLGETRYVRWKSIPEEVRTAAATEQKALGSVLDKLLRVQTKSNGDVIYHIPYERGSVLYSSAGKVVATASQSGGALQSIAWDKTPQPVQTAASAASGLIGDVDRNTIVYQTSGGKSLYHLLFKTGVVQSYSADGRAQDPATYLR